MLQGQRANRDKGSDTVVDDTASPGMMVKIKDPKALSLVGLPANSRPFSVIRSDEGTPAEPAAADKPPVLTRTKRRADANPVMRLTFPEGSTAEGVQESLKTYGMSGYVVAEENGIFTATRADLKSISDKDVQPIKLTPEGLIATVARMDATPTSGAAKQHIALAALEFDGEKFSADQVSAWLTEKSVDGTVSTPQNSGEGCVVRRSEVPAEEETRRMVLEDGVTAVIVRSDVADVPAGFVAVVNEAAYGNWGWGQLDFVATMADRDFSDGIRASLEYLNEVLRNIMLYSSLGLDVRKVLATRALTQFGDYIGTVMDSLPRQLIVSVTRSAANPQQEKILTNATKDAAATPAVAEVKTPAVAAPATEAPLTRADIAAMIAEGVTAGLKAAAPAAAASVVAAAPVVAAPAAEAALTRSDMAAMLAEAVKPLVADVAALKGTTVLRSDAADPAPAAPVVGKDGKPVAKDVFRGSIRFDRAGK